MKEVFVTSFQELTFDSKAINKILYAKMFNFRAILLLLLVSLSNALVISFYTKNVDFLGNYTFNSRYEQFFINLLSFFIVLVLIGFLCNLLLEFINVKEEDANYVRIVSSYAPLFLLKDILLIILMFFSIPSSGNISHTFTTFYDNFLLIIFLFIIYHLTITIKRSTELNTSMTVLIMLSVFFITDVLGWYYTGNIIKIFL